MSSKLDLLLVNPSGKKQMEEGLCQSLSGIEPPFWAGLLASFIRRLGYQVNLIDGEADNLSPAETAARVEDFKPLLVAIVVQGVNPSASSTTKMPAARELLKAIDGRFKTILVGLHPSALPERTLNEETADFVCQGEGFYTIPELLKGLKLGQGGWKIPGLYMKGYKENGRADLVSASYLPSVAWDLIDVTKYRAHNWHCLDDLDKRSPYAVIYTNLGCPYRCQYCNIHTLYSGNKPSVRLRPPESVIEEIDLLVDKYDVRNLKIMDELFTLNEQRVSRICQPLIERGYNLNIWAYAGIDNVTKEMLHDMKQAGINWLCYGIEAADPGVRLGMGKGFGQARISSVVEMTREAGINIIANFIFGLPGDSKESMRESLNMMKEYNFEYVNLYCAMAYPGSSLYDITLKGGQELPQSWAGYAQLGYETQPLANDQMTAAEVLAFRDRAFNEYFSRREYLSMVKQKFGQKAVEHVKEMLKHKIKRRLLGD